MQNHLSTTRMMVENNMLKFKKLKTIGILQQPEALHIQDAEKKQDIVINSFLCF
jgi:hypothetical protein